MNSEVTVVPATPEHVAVLAPLFDAYRVFYKASPDPDGAVRFLEARLNRNESKIFLAFMGPEGRRTPAGFTQLYPSFSSVSMKRLWILNDLFVVPEARRLGVGASLMERARAFAKEDGAKGLTLATQIQNATAQALYAKMGYVQDKQFLHFNFYF